MAKRVKRSTKRVARKGRKLEKNQTTFLSKSYTSLILGAIAVLVLGILALFFLSVHRNAQTSSSKDYINLEDQNIQLNKTSSTYTVRVGDDLWDISEKIYNDGYRWIEIAKLNNLQNPNLIHAGNKLSLPSKNLKQETAINSENGATGAIKANSYTVVKGDCLWDIAVRAYGDGFKWVEIAKSNNLTNPNLIHPGNVFRIPR